MHNLEVIKIKSKFLHRNILFISIAVLIALLTFFRIYNLDLTARFTEDESSDLVRMHEYYKLHKITLVGPISNDHTKVFSSLTYYMLMPFAAWGNFEPVSTAYGSAFWGILTAIIILFITSKLNKHMLPYAILLTLLWYPLLQTSRWAWNPHFIIFWIALGILFYIKKTNISIFLSGIFFGLSIHSHYISLVATSVFILLSSINLLLEKKIKQFIFLVLGYIIPFIPFLLFDLRHPPGLFLTRYIKGNISNTQSPSFLGGLQNIINNTGLFLEYITQNYYLAILLGILFVLILLFDLKTNKKSLFFLIPALSQLITGAFLDTLQTRYLLPGLIFLFAWLVFPRKSFGNLLSKLALGILIVGSLFSIYPQLNTIDVEPDIRTITKADKIIADLIHSKNLKNVNIAALGSKAPDTFAINMRNDLQIKDISFLAPSQYGVSEQLLVLSTTDSESLIKDQAFAMQQFKNSKLGGVFPVDKEWRIYWFRKI